MRGLIYDESIVTNAYERYKQNIKLFPLFFLLLLEFLHLFSELIHRFVHRTFRRFAQRISQGGYPARIVMFCPAAGNGIHHDVCPEDEQDKNDQTNHRVIESIVSISCI